MKRTNRIFDEMALVAVGDSSLIAIARAKEALRLTTALSWQVLGLRMEVAHLVEERVGHNILVDIGLELEQL